MNKLAIAPAILPAVVAADAKAVRLRSNQRTKKRQLGRWSSDLPPRKQTLVWDITCHDLVDILGLESPIGVSSVAVPKVISGARLLHWD